MTNQSVELKLPWIGPDDPAIEAVRWLVDEGQSVEIDQDILVLKVEGAEFVLPAPVDGLITEICITPGDWLSEGQLLAMIKL